MQTVKYSDHANNQQQTQLSAMNSPDYQLSAAGHRGTRAIQRLVEYAPASGGLALWMQHRDVDGAPAQARWAHTNGYNKTWIIGNNGTTIFYGPDFIQRSLSEQTGLVAHQVLHVALRHVTREQQLQQHTGELDAELFGVCADAIVNASLSHLSWLSLPKGSVQLDVLLERVLGIEEPLENSLHRWDTEALYRAVDDREQSGSPSQNKQHSNRHNASSQQAVAQSTETQHRNDGEKSNAIRQMAATMIRDLVPDANQSPELDEEQEQQWSERLLRAHAADGSQSLMRQLLADNRTSRTPWQHLLRTKLQRSLTMQTELNWSRPNRSWLANKGRTASGKRMPWQPGTSYARQCARLCVMVDVSGSVETRLMQLFANEIERLQRVHRADVFLIIGDDKVREQHRLKAGCKELRALTFEGGGGTDFEPLIHAANLHKPDIGVVLTDLDGPAGPAPAWPVIWMIPPDADFRLAPFGQKVVLD